MELVVGMVQGSCHSLYRATIIWKLDSSYVCKYRIL